MSTRSRRFATISFLTLASVVGCSGEEQIFKTSPPPRGLAILDAGLDPSEPIPLERPVAWATARDAEEVYVHVAFRREQDLIDGNQGLSEEDFESHLLDPISEPDERFERRYELRLPPRLADRVLLYYFEATATDAAKVALPLGGSEDPIPVGAQPIDIDFDWPSWPLPFEPFVCNFDRSLYDLDFAGPGLDFKEINNAIFVPPNRATILGNLDGLMEGVGVEIDGQPYFYPLAIMLWQEVANHTFGEKPSVLSYCPLTDTALFFYHENTRKAGRWEAGGLFNNNLVVIEPKIPPNKVPQMLAFALDGDRDGSCVDIQPSFLCNWNFWGRLYPDSRVLNGDRLVDDIDWESRENIYHSYWRNDEEIRFPIKFVDEERPLGLSNKDRVIGILGEGEPMAVALNVDGHQQAFVLNEDRGGRPMVIFGIPGQGFGAVFDRRLPATGEILSFKKVAASYNSRRLYEDDQPEPSLWMPTGVAIAGPLKGTRLTWVPSMRAFWFAWYAMYPGSQLINPYEGAEL